MYTEELLVGAVVPQSNAYLTARDLTAANATYAIWLVMDRIQVTRIFAYVSTQTLTGTTAPVLSYYRRPTYGSTTGEVLMGTITIPTASVVSTVVYKNIESVALQSGDCIVVKQTVQAADPGVVAGAAFVGFKAILKPNDPASEANMVKSA